MKLFGEEMGQENSADYMDSTNIDKIRGHLRADCGNCLGLCCVALYFSRSAGFPVDKKAGQPCPNLLADSHCCLYDKLKEKGYKGCLGFDCFGAGPKVVRVSFGGQDWRKDQVLGKRMFDVFLIMRQLHEMLWYLAEAVTLTPAHAINGQLKSMLEKTERLTHLSPEELLQIDMAAHREAVNDLLVKTSQFVRATAKSGKKLDPGLQRKLARGEDLVACDLRETNLCGANLRGALLITADLRGADLSGADLIGADLRDADIRGANLKKSLFLTQDQINVAKGDGSTKLPDSLICPRHW